MWRENSFIFKLSDFIHRDTDDYLKLKIVVLEKDETYDISYSWSVENCKSLLDKNLIEILKIYQFEFTDDDIFGECSGVIVHKNKMTEIIINYLLMDNEELYKYSGLTDVNTYRQNIMKNLENLWD